ncbi:MAG: cell division protein FtsQ [Rickettsiales bacterium]|jgi:cell division protein FtsQ
MWNIKISKIKAFIISRPTVRLVILFFHNKVFHYLKYFLYFLTIIFVVTVLYVSFFKKDTLWQVKALLVSYSYKIINYGNNYSEIKISGNKYTDYEDIAEIIRKKLVEGGDINNQVLITDLKNKIETFPWVKEVLIIISLQGTLNISVVEHEPFALWEGDEKYIVSSDGKLVAYLGKEKFHDLIILTGKNAYKNVRLLFSILAIDPEISKNVYSATWVGGRRWDIRFKNGLLVKLPSNNMNSAWDNLVVFYNTPGALIGLNAIDLRINNKTYLKYDSSSTQELINPASKL